MSLKINAALLGIGALGLLGCGRQGAGAVTPDEERPGEPAEFSIQNAQLQVAESWPVQVRLDISGTLSSTCHELAASVMPADPQGRIQVEASERLIEAQDCQAIAQPFRESIAIGSFSSGDYVVLLNGEVVGEVQLGPTPEASGEELERGPVFVDEAELELEGEAPVRVELVLRGSLPTPCDTLHWTVEPADAQGRIFIEVYSLRDPAVNCIQVLEPIDATLPVGSFSKGSYSVWLNGELVGEFEP